MIRKKDVIYQKNDIEERLLDMKGGEKHGYLHFHFLLMDMSGLFWDIHTRRPFVIL